MENNDIVARLRGWIPCYRADSDVAVDIANAADEIERLRNDLDGAQLAYRGASYDRDRMRTERDEGVVEIERLRAGGVNA